MGSIFLIALLLALPAFSSLMLPTRADSGPDSTRVTARSILHSPKAEESGDDVGPPGPVTVGPRKHNSSSGNSAIGGGVILGGLVAAIFTTLFCYIRVTRRRPAAENLA